MRTKSKKAKGRRLQNWVRDELLKRFPKLTDSDVVLLNVRIRKI
jgi:prophage antirepressor-like protein